MHINRQRIIDAMTHDNINILWRDKSAIEMTNKELVDMLMYVFITHLWKCTMDEDSLNEEFDVVTVHIE